MYRIEANPSVDKHKTQTLNLKTSTLNPQPLNLPHGGIRPFHQKSTCLTELTSGPYVVQIWSRNARNFEETKRSYSTVWQAKTPIPKPPNSPRCTTWKQSTRSTSPRSGDFWRACNLRTRKLTRRSRPPKRCVSLLITECIKEVPPLLPDPCHFQNYDQSMSQLSSGSEGPWSFSWIDLLDSSPNPTPFEFECREPYGGLSRRFRPKLCSTYRLVRCLCSKLFLIGTTKINGPVCQYHCV